VIIDFFKFMSIYTVCCQSFYMKAMTFLCPRRFSRYDLPSIVKEFWDTGAPRVICRVFKNRLKYDLKSNQNICQKCDLKSQSNRHFPKRFKIKIKSNRFTKWQIILVFLGHLSTCILILKIYKRFFKKIN
jgi:hypothetical protein